tara:strand:- start:963 stop:1529 length:567 start_codon:yes stop_codon:yes gene_type:complete
MKIVDANENIIQRLRSSNISTEMKSLESCDWFVIDEKYDEISGTAGLGGLFHVSGIQINEKFRGLGIGKKLQYELILESKKRGYSFITVFNDPRNRVSTKLHDSLGYQKLFRINYAKNIVNDVKGMAFNNRGKFVLNCLKLFNSKQGMLILALSLKIFYKIFPNLIIYNEGGLPKPSIKWITNNFEKI